MNQEVSASAQHTHGGGLCYFLVCFKDEEFVAFLLASLLRPQDLFLIHCDKKAPFKLKDCIYRAVDNYENVIKIKSQDYSWAGYSHVAVTLEAIATALNVSNRWSHFICLSEQHLPLKSPYAIEAYLRSRKSVAAMEKSSEMLPEAQADIQNRFSAFYRELPGVGCFATRAVKRQSDFYDMIFHGSNWLALCRDHCRYLSQAERDGRFEIFQTIVHAEETAFPSILAPLRAEIENFDVTLVAAPHLVENRGLEMTDDLFRWGIDTPHLFIRKRTKVLSDFVLNFVKQNYFQEELYLACLDGKSIGLHSDDSDQRFIKLRTDLDRELKNLSQKALEVQWIDPNSAPFTVRFHVAIRSTNLGMNRSIRVLSENLKDFKVCLVEEEAFEGPFPLPYVQDGALHSILRVKINGFFGLHDVLPIDTKDDGFVSLPSNGSISTIVELVEAFLSRNTIPELGHLTPAFIASTDDRRSADHMRANRINRLAVLAGAQRYLEVGVCFGDTFFAVNVPEKVAVDPAFRFDVETRRDPATSFHAVPSDVFFEKDTGKPFDVIYLDGLHTFDQTTRDFFNSMRLSHDNTIWLIDDTVPNDPFSSLADQALCYHLRAQIGNPDASWMGDVYKTVFLIERTLPFFHFRTFEGHGQTVIWRSKKARRLVESGVDLDAIGRMTFIDFLIHKSVLGFDTDENIYDAISKDISLKS